MRLCSSHMVSTTAINTSLTAGSICIYKQGDMAPKGTVCYEHNGSIEDELSLFSSDANSDFIEQERF